MILDCPQFYAQQLFSSFSSHRIRDADLQVAAFEKRPWSRPIWLNVMIHKTQIKRENPFRNFLDDRRPTNLRVWFFSKPRKPICWPKSNLRWLAFVKNRLLSYSVSNFIFTRDSNERSMAMCCYYCIFRCYGLWFAISRIIRSMNCIFM